MAMRVLDEKYKENLAKAVEAYKDHTISVEEIVNEYKVAYSTLMREIDKAGIPRRSPKRATRTKYKKCTKCGNDKNLYSAKFCFNCGADIRDNILILIDKLHDALANTSFLPESMRGEVSETIREAIAEFKKLSSK